MRTISTYGVETRQVYGRITVLSVDGTQRPNAIVECQCECGKHWNVIARSLAKGSTQSCGCLGKERREAALTKHGLTETLEYSVWTKMRSRCQKPNDPRYPDYGARGITAAPEWEDFGRFIADIPPRPSLNHTLDRIDNDRGYWPGNVKWSTRQEQNNNRRDNHLIAYQGRTQTLAEWAREVGMDYQTLQRRINHLKWPTEKTLTTPVRFVTRPLKAESPA